MLQQNDEISSITISGFDPQIKPWILPYFFLFLFFLMDNTLALSSLHFNWNVNKQPFYSEDNNISIYLEK